MSSKGNMQQQTYPAEKARQGQIILRTPLRRMIFLAGLVGMVVLAALWFVFGR